MPRLEMGKVMTKYMLVKVYRRQKYELCGSPKQVLIKIKKKKERKVTRKRLKQGSPILMECELRKYIEK